MKFEINHFRNDSLRGSNPGASGYERKLTPIPFLIAIAILAMDITAFPKFGYVVMLAGLCIPILLAVFGSSIMAGIQGISHFKRPEDK